MEKFLRTTTATPSLSLTDVKSDIYKEWKTEITLSGNIITERLVDDFENHFWNPTEGTFFIGLKKQMISVKLMQRYDQHTEDECFLIPVQDFSYITSILKIQWGMYLVRVCFYNNQGVVIHAHQLKRTNKMKFPSKGLQTVQQIDYS